MDITNLRIAVTLACFAAFIGIFIWAYLGRNTARFEEAAHLPFEQD